MRPGKPRSPVSEHIEERGDLRSVSGWECPGNGGESERKATSRVRRELTAQVAEQRSREGHWLLQWTGEVPAEAAPRHGCEFRSSKHIHMSCFVTAMRSPRDDNSPPVILSPDPIGTKNLSGLPGECRRPFAHISCAQGDRTAAPGNDNSSPSLRAQRSNPTKSLRAKRGNLYNNNVDHSSPWCILHGEGAGRSWAFGETSNLCLR